ncbi:hypothetical protein [Actinoallomurus vinaceus]|uniref:hypothetical protein n=1 Tax=Actinoallomurus vinaceus TaxID=1080074 RepID=UPI0031E774C2
MTAGDSIAHFARPTDKDASYTPVRPVVQDAVTGKVLYTIPLPRGVWSSWGQVAAAPDNRTFVIAGLSLPAGGEFSYFRVHLSEDRRPDTRLIPGLTVPESAESTTVTLSPDGRRLAYRLSTGVGVADIATGQRRTWTIKNGEAPETTPEVSTWTARDGSRSTSAATGSFASI